MNRSVEVGHAPFISRLLMDGRVAPVILALTMAQQMLGHLNADNSWLFTAAELLLDGGRPYVDFIESNPPASFLIYFPAVCLARSLGAPCQPVEAQALRQRCVAFSGGGQGASAAELQLTCSFLLSTA